MFFIELNRPKTIITLRKKIIYIGFGLLAIAIVSISYFFYLKEQKIKQKAYLQTDKQTKILLLDSIQINSVFILNYERIKTNLKLKGKLKKDKKLLIQSLKAVHADYEIKLLEILTVAQKQKYQLYRMALKKRMIKEKVGKMFHK